MDSPIVISSILPVEISFRLFLIPPTEFFIHIPEKWFLTRDRSHHRDFSSNDTDIREIDQTPEVFSREVVEVYGSRYPYFTTDLKYDDIVIYFHMLEHTESFLIGKNRNPYFFLESFIESHTIEPDSSRDLSFRVFPDASCSREG